MHVLGVDPGFANLGYGVVDLRALREDAVAEAGVIRTEKSSKKQDVFAANDTFRRAEEIATALRRIFSVFPIRAVCVEAISYPRNASAGAKVGMAWGVLASFTSMLDLPVVFSTPKQLKINVAGSASASKDDIGVAVLEYYGDAWLARNGLTRGILDHATDSLAAVISAEKSPIMRALK